MSSAAAPPPLTLIAAVARNGVVGDGQRLPWRLPEDMRFFRITTTGHAVIMGRKTWDSLQPRFRPLPGRRNIVLTRQAGLDAAGAEAVPSLGAALALLAGASESFVIGGASVWTQALPLAQTLLLTEIDRDFDGDVRFPDWDRGHFREISREPHRAGPPNDFDFAFVRYQRITG